MLPQRACDDENQVKNKSANGPPRAQSNVNAFVNRVFCDVLAYVSCRGYVSTPLSAQYLLRIKVATRIKSVIRPWQNICSVKDFFVWQDQKE